METEYRLVEDGDGLIVMAHVINPSAEKRRFVACSCLAGHSYDDVKAQFDKWTVAMDKSILHPNDFENGEDLA